MHLIYYYKPYLSIEWIIYKMVGFMLILLDGRRSVGKKILR